MLPGPTIMSTAFSPSTPQAIASLAFVQIVVSFNFYAEGWTGGAQGFGGIPKLVGTGTLLIAALATFYLIYGLSQTRIGRAFDAAREDEAMASSLGVNVTWFQALAFGLSGLIAGLFGGLEALHSYAIEPNQFGFNLIIVILSYVVFGGRKSIWGPLVGTAILLAAYAWVLGLVALRSWRVAVGGIALFGLVGAVAAVTRHDAGVPAALPSLVGAVLAAPVLRDLLSKATVRETETADGLVAVGAGRPGRAVGTGSGAAVGPEPGAYPEESRRRFLKALGITGVV